MFLELLEKHCIFGRILKSALAFVPTNWGTQLFLLLLAVGLRCLPRLPSRFCGKRWCAYVMLCVTIALLVPNVFVSAISMNFGLTQMLVPKSIKPDEALEDMSISGVTTIAILFIVAESIQKMFVLVPVFRLVLGNPRYLCIALARLCF